MSLQHWQSQIAASLESYVAKTPLAGGTFQYVPAFFLILSGVFYMGYTFWGVYGLKGKSRGEVSSCWMSVFHGIITTVLSTYEVYRLWPVALDAPNTPEQAMLMQFTMAYMLADTFVFLLPFTPGDTLFLGHHFLVVVYNSGCLLVRRGGISVMVLTALGESTSIFQNSWLIARNTRHNSRASMKAFNFLSPVYTVVFVLVRSVIAPPTVSWLIWRLHDTPGLPLPARYTWATIAFLGTAGSQIWTYKLIQGLRKHNAQVKLEHEHPKNH